MKNREDIPSSSDRGMAFAPSSRLLISGQTKLKSIYSTNKALRASRAADKRNKK